MFSNADRHRGRYNHLGYEPNKIFISTEGDDLHASLAKQCLSEQITIFFGLKYTKQDEQHKKGVT